MEKRVVTVAQAIEMLNDYSESVLEREKAIEVLRLDPSPAGIEALVRALEDDVFGIRWTAAAALATLGEAALPPLLRTLVEHARNSQLRESAYHILHYNTHRCVRRECTELMQALKGPASDIAVIGAASALLHKMGQTVIRSALRPA